MADLDTIARRAGDAARAEARARGQRMTSPSRGRARVPLWARPVLAAVLLVVVVVVAAVTLGDGRSGSERDLVIDPLGPSPAPEGLVVPEVGMASAGTLDDGTPVFVSRPEEGTVLVLDATSPHQGNKLIAFCARSGWFEDLHHGSRFTAWGDWVAGPSPTGLPAYPSELTSDGRHVRVTGPAGPAPDRGTPRGPDEGPPKGPACEPGYDDLSSAVVHRPPAVPPELGGDEIPADRWVWATLRIGGAGDRAVICEVGGWCPDGAPEIVPAIPLSHTGAGEDAVRRVVWLVRAGPDRTVQMRRPGMPVDDPGEDWPHGLFPVPAPGEAVAFLGVGDRPIFVATDDAGEVRILDATSPRQPVQLLGWCPEVGRFADGTGAEYDVTGAAVDGGTGMHGYPVEVDDLGRGVRAARVSLGAQGWGRPTFSSVVAPSSARQPLPCADPVAHVPGQEREVDGDGPSLDERGSWFWVEARVRVVGGDARVCLVSGSCDARDDPVVVTPGADGIPWPDEPAWLFVEVDEDTVPGPDGPHRVHVRLPVLSGG